VRESSSNKIAGAGCPLKGIRPERQNIGSAGTLPARVFLGIVRSTATMSQIATRSAAETKPATATTRELTFQDGASNKFWTISLDGCSHTVRFGRGRTVVHAG
jgi:hypothetical protein